MEERVEMNEQLMTLRKYEGLGAAMAGELMIDFWFGIGVILAITVGYSLDYCGEELKSRK